MAEKDQNTASTSQNAKLKHSEGGVTTREDVTDLGVPMLAGDPTESQGPEDALGAGPKRGDYSGRVGDAYYQPHQVVPNPDAKEGEPTVKVLDQRTHVGEVGDEKGEKGGVTT